MKRYEYNVITLIGEVRGQHWEATLNAAGAEGWRLVSVDQGVAYFRRELIESVLTEQLADDILLETRKN